jgi:hypothetical protein
MPTDCIVDDAAGVLKGDALCLVGWDAGATKPKVARATRTTLGASSTVYGIAPANAGDTDPLPQVLVAGDVAPEDVTSLGAGTSRIIATDVNAATAADQCRSFASSAPTAASTSWAPATRAGTSRSSPAPPATPRRASCSTSGATASPALAPTKQRFRLPLTAAAAIVRRHSPLSTWHLRHLSGLDAHDPGQRAGLLRRGRHAGAERGLRHPRGSHPRASQPDALRRNRFSFCGHAERRWTTRRHDFRRARARLRFRRRHRRSQ